MFGSEVLLVLALAVFTAALVRARPAGRREPSSPSSGLVDAETVRGFALIGAAALALLAVVAAAVGVLARHDQAEGLAVIGLFGYVAYLALMVPLSGWLSRR
ncbi:hypothetical protein [uncultured Friedmanniella sp.]|uniref:hypothetical protein n=1 Tax=uncultured Friedmanniella sp. TaxID=335381 RepID=UPI0035CB86DE